MLKKSHIAILAAGAFCAAQTGAAWLDDFAGSEQITVFTEDGYAYSVTPVDIDVAILEPSSDEFIVAMAEPVIVAMTEPVIVAMTEPFVVAARQEDISVHSLPKRDL